MAFHRTPLIFYHFYLFILSHVLQLNSSVDSRGSKMTTNVGSILSQEGLLESISVWG